MKENNIAFIDGQNLHLGTSSAGWKVDFQRFRIYLRDKFAIQEAYIFLGFLDDNHQGMYRKIQKAGFILEFREHNQNMKGTKKGNVDVDIVFEIMHRLIEEDDFDQMLLVTGDGDYIKTVKYLIEKKRLKKILFPNQSYSSLYKPFKDLYGMNMSQDRVRCQMEHKQ